MFNNWIARIRLGEFFGFNSEESKIVTEIFDAILRERWINVEITFGHIEITTDNSIVNFWDMNKYYAWAEDGIFRRNGKCYSWKSERPSADAMYRMKQRLKQWNTLKFKEVL